MDHAHALEEAPTGSSVGRLLPRGGTLPEHVWRSRHRGITLLLWLHAPVVLAVALSAGVTPLHAGVETGVVIAFAALVHWSRGFRGLSTGLATVGLLTCSAILVHLSDGVIEMHFHYFVVVAVVTLYQDWRPLLLAIAYVVVHHTVAGVIDPSTVYNHPAAAERPAQWAGIHAAFIVGLAVTGVVTWRLNETLLDQAVRRERGLAAAQVELLETLSLLNATLDSTTEGILVVSLDRRIVSYNRAFLDLWEVPEHVLRKDDDDAVIAHAVAQLVDPQEFQRQVAHVYTDPESVSHDTLEFRDGRIVERMSRPQYVHDEVVGRVWSFRDVTETVRLAEELSHQALHDSLTDIANQALFRDRVDHALAMVHQRGGHLGVLLIDLDDFKTINDGLGRTAGDQLLVAVSRRIQGCLRSVDTLARLGGDEFAVLVEDSTGRVEAEHAAVRILEALRQPFSIGGSDVVVGASIGVALAGREEDTDGLLRNADLAMYAAKNGGKNRSSVYSDDMYVAAMTRVTVETELRHAIDQGQLRVHYQPIVCLRTGVVRGVEALVRWEHPVHGLWAPVNFIDVAECTGLINPLGRWVLGEACAQVRTWNQTVSADRPLHLSVNLSARQLHDGNVVEEIASTLRESGLEPDRLIVEITESAMIQNFDASAAELAAVKDLGVRVAIDDFGTGYASLSYLQRLPADVVKIDRSFVQRIALGAEESALARAIVRMAHMLQLAAVAEGVETAEQTEVLARLGCEYAQGYWFSRPVDADSLGELLAAGGTFSLPLPAGAERSR